MSWGYQQSLSAQIQKDISECCKDTGFAKWQVINIFLGKSREGEHLVSKETFSKIMEWKRKRTITRLIWKSANKSKAKVRNA